MNFEFVKTLPRPRALDLFSGGGGAGFGLQQAGFRTVVGVDIKDQPNYSQARGMHFRKGDVLKLKAKDLQLFDFVWSSPPCQFATGIIPDAQRAQFEKRWQEAGRHVNMIPATRKLLKAGGTPYVIENVMGAKKHMNVSVKLCGTMFPEDDLRVFRQRIFESNVPMLTSPTPTCQKNGKTLGGRAPKQMVATPKTEKLVAGSDGSLPKGFDTKPVEFPSRQGMRTDFIYLPTTPENAMALKKMYNRNFARSVREALRAVGYLVPMTDGEKKKEIERYEAQMAGKRPPNQSSESDFFPIYGTDIRRGTTEQWRSALGIPWMTREQLREAIPPAYSRHLGKQVIASMKR